MRRIYIFILLMAALSVSACSSEPTGSSTAAESAGGSTALSNAEEAEERAGEWNEDAQLYAVAAATPQLDAEGNAPDWLYTYVSESAGAVATVSYESGAIAMDPEQELPEADIGFLTENALPPVEELIDSSEAIEEAADVGAILEEEPGAETAAGLDSVSGGEPVWRFSTIQGEERVEEQVPALSGGS